MMASASAAATVVNAAQKAQTFANNTVETARFDILKEPLGFIKIIQILLAILAFAIAVNGSSSLNFTVNCPTDGYITVSASFGYPYDLTNTPFISQPTQKCTKAPVLDRNTITSDSTNIVSSAQFFVFVGVTAFLYSLAFAIIYVFFRQKYTSMVFFPLGDLAFTTLYALFWFIASAAWAKAVTDIQKYTNTNDIITSFTTACPQTSCSYMSSPSLANVIVSCILGFGNWLVWSGNVWFVAKETSWYKTRQQLQQQQQQQQSFAPNPISINDVNISAHYNPNSKI